MASNSGSLSTLLGVDFKNTFVETGKELPTEYTEIVNVMDMTHQNEKDIQISGLGTMPTKNEGGQFTTDDPVLGGTKTYTARTLGLAFETTFELWITDQSGVLQKMVQGLARAARNREEVDGHAVLNNAHNTSFNGFTASEALISTSHALLGGGTLANAPTTSQTFGMTYLQGMIQRFHSLTDHRGLPKLMRPDLVVVDPSNLWLAREILGSQSKPFTANNEINSMTPEGLRFMVDHYITTSTHHFTLAQKSEHDLSMRYIVRPMFDSFDDPRTKSMVSTVYGFWTTSQFGSWYGIDGSGN